MFENEEIIQEADTTTDDTASEDTTDQEIGSNLDGDDSTANEDVNDSVAEHLRIKGEPKKEEQAAANPEPEEKEEEHTTVPNKEEYPDRPLEDVEKEYNRLIQDGVNDFISLQKNFLALAKAPEGIGYTPEQAFQYGIETGDYDAFLECLTPIQVKQFLHDKNDLDSKYNTQLEKINKEKDHKAYVKHKQEDIAKWDGYIKEVAKDSPAKTHILNFLKQESGFSKEKIDQFLKALDEGLALEQNIKSNKQQTADLKKAMMGTIPVQAKTSGKDYASLTLDEVLKLPPTQYEKWKETQRKNK